MKKCVNCGNIENNNSSVCGQCGGNLISAEENAVICSACGGVVPAGSKFCGKCGNIVNHVENNICKNCGNPLTGGALFCGRCGAPTKSESDYAITYCFDPGSSKSFVRDDSRHAYVSGKRKNTNLILVIILIIILLGITVTATYIVVRDKGAAERVEQPDNNKKQEDDKQKKLEEEEKQRELQELEELRELEEREQREKLERQKELERQKNDRYRVHSGNITWGEANSRANSNYSNGKLICINNAEEFATACNKAENAGLNAFWAGAYLPAYESSWGNVRWIDGSSMYYTKWKSGEPSYVDYNYNISENYLMIFKYNGSWYFNDAPSEPWKYNGALKLGYIVELGD